MNDAIFCKLHLRGTRTCQRNIAHAACTGPVAVHLPIRERAVFYYCREGIPQDASCSPYSFSVLSPAHEPASDMVVVLLLLSEGLSLYAHQGAYVHTSYSPRGGTSSLLLNILSWLG